MLVSNHWNVQTARPYHIVYRLDSYPIFFHTLSGTHDELRANDSSSFFSPCLPSARLLCIVCVCIDRRAWMCNFHCFIMYLLLLAVCLPADSLPAVCLIDSRFLHPLSSVSSVSSLFERRRRHPLLLLWSSLIPELSPVCYCVLCKSPCLWWLKGFDVWWLDP